MLGGIKQPPGNRPFPALLTIPQKFVGLLASRPASTCASRQGKHMSSYVDPNARNELAEGMGRSQGLSGRAIRQRPIRRHDCKGCQP
jgi:hypothetical protein